MTRFEGLRRQPTQPSDRTRIWALVRVLWLDQVCPDWRIRPNASIPQVLDGVWRASSLMECLNRVARMRQSRHRKMTQGLLDLIRLYGNLRKFRTDPRKGRTPNNHLGLKLPDLVFGDFLRLTPDELRKQLSTQDDRS